MTKLKINLQKEVFYSYFLFHVLSYTYKKKCTCSTCNMCQYLSLFYFSPRFEKAPFSTDFYENWNKILILIQIFKGNYQHWYKALLNRQYRWGKWKHNNMNFYKSSKHDLFYHIQVYMKLTTFVLSTSALENIDLQRLCFSIYK